MDAFTVVICHGSYQTPVPYKPFITALQKQRIEAYCPQLPTADLKKLNVSPSPNGSPDFNSPPPATGYPQPADDAVVINELLDKLIQKQGKNVLLFGHSSGGFLATYVSRQKYEKKARQENNLEGGIIGIFYACAFLVPVGESCHSFFEPKDGSEGVVPPFCRFHGNGFEGIASTVDTAKYFFNGLPEDEAKYYESIMTAGSVLTTVLDHDAYSKLPCAALICEKDLALPVLYQEMMVEIQSKREETDFTVYKCDAGHSPHLTWTDGLVECVQEWAATIV